MKRLKAPFTKYAVSARKDMGLTQEEAAELLGIHPSTLQKYERDELRIHDDIALSMSQVFHDPALKQIYCQYECAIGRQEKHCDCEKGMQALLLDALLTEETDMKDVAKTLWRITADGIIDESEQDDCERCLDYLDRMAKRLEALKVQLERIVAKGC